MKKTLVYLLFFLSISLVRAQVYSYKYLYNVTPDGIKIKSPCSIPAGSTFYFTFNSNKSRCFLTDKNGIANNSSSFFNYVGEQNGIYVYRETADNNTTEIAINTIGGHGELLFSKDFQRLNWKCYLDNWCTGKKGDPGYRVFQYTRNSNEVQTPRLLY